MTADEREALAWFRSKPHVLEPEWLGHEPFPCHAATIVRAALARDTDLDGWATMRWIAEEFDCHEVFVIGEDQPCGKCPPCIAQAAVGRAALVDPPLDEHGTVPLSYVFRNADSVSPPSSRTRGELDR